MADISISKSRGKKYLGGASPMVPAFIVGDDPIPLNPPGTLPTTLYKLLGDVTDSSFVGKNGFVPVVVGENVLTLQSLATNYVTIATSQTITGAKIFDNSLLVLTGSSATFRIASNNNLATLNFRANNVDEKATLEFSDATNVFSIATRVNNSDIAITPHGTGKIKLSNVPSGSGTILAIDGSNNLVKSTLISSGTFTPTLLDGLTGGTATYTYTSSGAYIKIDTLVYFSVSLNITSTTGSPSQPLYISGLPFVFAGFGGENGMFSISEFKGSSLSTTEVGLLAVNIQNFASTILRFIKIEDGTTFSSVTITSGRIAIAGTYTTS